MRKLIAGAAAAAFVVIAASPAQASDTCNKLLVSICVGDSGLSLSVPPINQNAQATPAPTPQAPVTQEPITAPSSPTPAPATSVPSAAPAQAAPGVVDSPRTTTRTPSAPTVSSAPAAEPTLDRITSGLPSQVTTTGLTQAAPTTTSEAGTTTTPAPVEGPTVQDNKTGLAAADTPIIETRYVRTAGDDFKLSIGFIMLIMVLALAAMLIMFRLGKREAETTFNEYMLDVMRNAHQAGRRRHAHRS